MQLLFSVTPTFVQVVITDFPYDFFRTCLYDRCSTTVHNDECGFWNIIHRIVTWNRFFQWNMGLFTFQDLIQLIIYIQHLYKQYPSNMYKYVNVYPDVTLNIFFSLKVDYCGCCDCASERMFDVTVQYTHFEKNRESRYPIT